MISAYFTIGSKCNHKCIFCPCQWERRDHEISLSVFKERIQEIETNDKIDSVILSGGEPTIQCNFFELLRYLNQTRFYVRLLTNADRLSDLDMVEKIKSVISPSKMDIITAIHSDDSKTHDSITGSKGSFFRTNRGLQNIIHQGYQVNLKFCISRINYKRMGNFVDFVYDNFPDSVSLSFCSIDYCGRANKNSSIVAVEYKEAKRYLEDALEKIEDYENKSRKRNIIVTNTPLCSVEPKYWKYFICDSKKNTEAFLPLPIGGKGKIKYNSASGSGTFFQACKKCDVEKYCAGAWYTAYQIFGENCVKPIQIG